jgi:hypothetical protein
MVFGGIALLCYSVAVCQILMRSRLALWRGGRVSLFGECVDPDRGQLMVREMGTGMFGATARSLIRG